MKHLFVGILMAALAAPAFANPAATEALNALRASKGRPAVTYSKVLERVAKNHVQDMVKRKFFSHTGSNGSSVGQRVKRAGYKWCYVSENIAQGQRGLGTVMNAWANSAGHRKNMLNRKAREFGLASGPGNTWVMVLAKPC